MWKTWKVACSVLIVDDHRGFRVWARQFLEAAGYFVAGEAGDGGDAIRVAGRSRPDVVLLDVHLPDMDGFEVARRLTRADGNAPDVVFISSREASDFGRRIIDSGALGFISKEELSGETLGSLLAGRMLR